MVNGEGYVTIATAAGPVTMPAVQADAVAVCVDRLRRAGVTPVWHANACGCCYSVHGADPTTPRGGYVVGRDGGYEWYEVVE